MKANSQGQIVTKDDSTQQDGQIDPETSCCFLVWNNKGMRNTNRIHTGMFPIPQSHPFTLGGHLRTTFDPGISLTPLPRPVKKGRGGRGTMTGSNPLPRLPLPGKPELDGQDGQRLFFSAKGEKHGVKKKKGGGQLMMRIQMMNLIVAKKEKSHRFKSCMFARPPSFPLFPP